MISYKSYIQVIIVTKNNSTIDHLCNDIIAYYALYLYDNKNKNEVLLQVLRRVYITTWLNTFAIKHLNEKKENVECRSHLHINPFYMTTCVKVFSQNVQLPVKVSFTTIGIAGGHYNIAFCTGVPYTFNTITPITCKNETNFVLLLRALKLIVINNDLK